MNNVKPTKLQKETYKHLKRGLILKDAMIAAGYSKKSAENPKQNFMDRRGSKELVEELKRLHITNGFSLDMLSEIQMEGLTDQNAAVRLQYIKEFKKDFNIGLPDDLVQTNVQIVFGRGDNETD
jgi:hypothetical protein